MKKTFPERPAGWINRSTWMIAVAYSFIAVALFFLLDPEAWRMLFGTAAFLLFLLGVLPLLQRLRPAAPIISLDDDMLTVRRPGISPGDWCFPLPQLEKIEIRGPKGRRYWRVHLEGSNVVEIPPLLDGWQNSAEIDFMQREVAKHVPVVVEQSPTLFAQIRGDFE